MIIAKFIDFLVGLFVRPLTKEEVLADFDRKIAELDEKYGEQL